MHCSGFFALRAWRFEAFFGYVSVGALRELCEAACLLPVCYREYLTSNTVTHITQIDGQNIKNYTRFTFVIFRYVILYGNFFFVICYKIFNFYSFDCLMLLFVLFFPIQQAQICQ